MFWAISAALMLWGLSGASISIAFLAQTPERFAEMVEAAENRQAYARYLATIPTWGIVIGLVASMTRLLGAIALLLRRAWALAIYVASTVFFMAAMFRAFVLADVASVMSGAHIAGEFVFLAVSIFAVWFAGQSKLRGILQGSPLHDALGARRW